MLRCPTMSSTSCRARISTRWSPDDLEHMMAEYDVHVTAFESGVGPGREGVGMWVGDGVTEGEKMVLGQEIFGELNPFFDNQITIITKNNHHITWSDGVLSCGPNEYLLLIEKNEIAIHDFYFLTLMSTNLRWVYPYLLPKR